MKGKKEAVPRPRIGFPSSGGGISKVGLADGAEAAGGEADWVELGLSLFWNCFEVNMFGMRFINEPGTADEVGLEFWDV